MTLETQERIVKAKKLRLKLAEKCRNLTDAPVGEGTSNRLYCGTEDYVDFFKTVISTLGLDVNYEVEEVDGELEIVLF